MRTGADILPRSAAEQGLAGAGMNTLETCEYDARRLLDFTESRQVFKRAACDAASGRRCLSRIMAAAVGGGFSLRDGDSSGDTTLHGELKRPCRSQSRLKSISSIAPSPRENRVGGRGTVRSPAWQAPRIIWKNVTGTEKLFQEQSRSRCNIEERKP